MVSPRHQRLHAARSASSLLQEASEPLPAFLRDARRRNDDGMDQPPRQVRARTPRPKAAPNGCIFCGIANVCARQYQCKLTPWDAWAKGAYRRYMKSNPNAAVWTLAREVDATCFFNTFDHLLEAQGGRRTSNMTTSGIDVFLTLQRVDALLFYTANVLLTLHVHAVPPRLLFTSSFLCRALPGQRDCL